MGRKHGVIYWLTGTTLLLAQGNVENNAKPEYAVSGYLEIKQNEFCDPLYDSSAEIKTLPVSITQKYLIEID